MIREIRINYVLATPENWGKVELACSELGWSKNSIIKQMLHGFLRRDGKFYAEAALLDAQARRVSETDYFRTLRDQSEKELPRYSNGSPAFGRSPLDDIEEIPSGEDHKHRYNLIGLSAYNYVLLRVAQIVHPDPLVQIVSKMIVKHLDDNWSSVYQPQIDRDQQCKFL